MRDRAFKDLLKSGCLFQNRFEIFPALEGHLKMLVLSTEQCLKSELPCKIDEFGFCS